MPSQPKDKATAGAPAAPVPLPPMTDYERGVYDYAVFLRSRLAGPVEPPHFLGHLGMAWHAEYGNGANAWSAGMGTCATASSSGDVYAVCTNCFVGKNLVQVIAGFTPPIQDEECLRCGRKPHVLMRIAAKKTPGVAKLGPIAEVNMERHELTSGGPKRVPAKSPKAISALEVRTTVRSGSAFAALVPRPENSAEKNAADFVRSFSPYASAISWTAGLKIGKREIRPVITKGIHKFPLISGHETFGKFLNGTISQKSRIFVDGAGTITLNSIAGTGSYGHVYYIAAGNNEYALKVVIAESFTITKDANGAEELEIRGDGFPAIDEYVIGRMLRNISDDPANGQPGMLETSMLMPHCMFGVFLPSGFTKIIQPGSPTFSSRQDVHYETAVAMCIALPPMKQSLNSILSGISTRAQGLTLVKHLFKKMFRSFAVLHEQGFVHADIKCDNILLSCPLTQFTTMANIADSARVCDYSLSTFSNGVDNCMSADYRAPEVWLGLTWGPAIDVWGLGCVAIEIVSLGRLPCDFPLPRCNVDHPMQYVVRLVEYFFPVPEHMLTASKYPDVVTQIRQVQTGRPASARYSLAGLLFGVPIPATPEARNFLDLIEKMLIVDPEKRITARQVLSHPFLA